jgi:hypothetical protein
MSRLHWPPIIGHAAELVAASNDQGHRVTLRQLFYRLVASSTLPNTLNAYNRLGRLTAQARRAGTFPRLHDQGRAIHRPPTWDGPDHARRWLQDAYRRDRTEGQPCVLYLGVEKATQLDLLLDISDDLGLPALALRGYAGQELVTDTADDIKVSKRNGQQAVLLYAGDFDPSGEDIPADFIRRVGGFDVVERVALDAGQVRAYDLPPQLGKATDPRASAFEARHGRLVQVELEALAPGQLVDLYRRAIARYWDEDAFRAALGREAIERAMLA